MALIAQDWSASVTEIVTYLVGVGVVAVVVLALIVWDVRATVRANSKEIERLRQFRHDLENEGLGEHFRRKFTRPEGD